MVRNALSLIPWPIGLSEYSATRPKAHFCPRRLVRQTRGGSLLAKGPTPVRALMPSKLFNLKIYF